MALKKKITKEQFEKLSELLKAEYVEKDGEYVLDIDGEEDTGALKRAKDREVQLRKDAETKARELEERLNAIEGDDARKKGDIQTLEKSWQKKVSETEAQYKARIDKLTGYTTKTLIDGTAGQIAGKISKVPGLMARAIRDRMTVDFDGDEPTLRILDAQGKPSALTLDELQAEFVANPEYADIIIGTKASGGGTAKDGRQTVGSAAFSGDGKPRNLASMNPKELAELISQKRNEKA